MDIKLMSDSFTDEEISAAINCLKSGMYTQGKIVEQFEQEFAKWNGQNNAIMVNSGSSANLLMAFMLKEKFGLQDGDEVLVPSVTWPTTVYPIIQHNLVPVFCDADESYNMSIDSLKRMISSKTRAVFIAHILGQPLPMDEIVSFCKSNNLLLIEDCCEAMGATYKGKKVGTFGEMASFSLYFAHHITTIEGGIITTNDSQLTDLIKSSRSHGWVRNSIRKEKYRGEFVNLDFVFDMVGYNVRSTNLNAAIGLVQLSKLNDYISQRKKNHLTFTKALEGYKKITLQKINIDETSAFSLGIILSSKEERDFLLKKLPSEGVECRPMIAGNLLRQPVFNRKDIVYRKDICSYADIIHDRGMYLPNNPLLNEQHMNYMALTIKRLLESIPQKQDRILITGGNGFLGKSVIKRLNEKGYTNLFIPLRSQYDLTKEIEVEKLFLERGPFKTVIHLAAIVGGIGFNKAHPGTSFYGNIMMNTLVQEYARRQGVSKFIGVGSVCSYPKITPVPFKENELWNGYPEETNAPYGLAKKMLLVQSQAYKKEYGFNPVHLLMINLYGPEDNFSLEHSHVVPALIRKISDAKINGKSEVTLWGTGSASREFLFVEDAAEAIVKAMETHNQIEPLNIGSGQEVTIKELSETIAKLLNFQGVIKWDTSKPDGQPRRCLDMTNAEKHLDFKAKTSLESGLRKTIDWYRLNQDIIRK